MSDGRFRSRRNTPAPRVTTIGDMNLWLDNTGIQSAALCLEGRAGSKLDYDIRGLLQLATYLVYGSNLKLNGFEDETVAQKTLETVQRLREFDVGPNVLSVCPIEEQEYALACRTAAESASSHLCDSFCADEEVVYGGHPPELPRGLKKQQIEFVALAEEPDESQKLIDAMRSALSAKAAGAVTFMVASNRPLRNEVAKLVASIPNWQERHSYQINHKCPVQRELPERNPL